jgi:hypothetical protein
MSAPQMPCEPYMCPARPAERKLPYIQMIINWPITAGDGGKTYLTIGKPVLQRMLDGKTLGIAIKPLGAISASFYSMENEAGKYAARLYFDLQK